MRESERPAVGPTFVIGGAQKAATTSLFFLLDEHPDVYASVMKEPGFFAYVGGQERWEGPGARGFSRSIITDPADYARLFTGGEAYQHRMEGSTLYLSNPHAPRRLAAFDPAIKVVFVLRDPADRIQSAFGFLRMKGLEPLPSVLEAIAAAEERRRAGWPPYFDYLHLSSYGTHLRWYMDHLPSSQILCIKYERFVSSPGPVVGDVERFLGLRSYARYALGRQHNPSGEIRSGLLQKALDIRAPRIRGRLRKMAPRFVHRALVEARRWNLRERERDLDARKTLTARLESEIQAVEAICGTDLVEGWRHVP